MGNAASSPRRAPSASSSSSPARAFSTTPATEPRPTKMLVNAAPRASASNFRSPAAITAASVNRQARSQSPEARSASLQQAALQRRQRIPGTNGSGTNVHGHVGTEEDLFLAFTRNADPISLRVLELIQQADAVPLDSPGEQLRLLQECYPLLERVPNSRFDQLAVTVYQKEGDVYHQQGDIENAKNTYSRAITLAEKRVARQEADMYMVLKRYVLAMVGMARIWYNHERDHQGFTFVDHKHHKVQAVDGGDALHDANSSMSSLESSLMSDGGSVFSLNEAILKSMAPRPPRRQTGPHFQRVKMRAPHVMQSSQLNREDEFVLHSRMTRELVASPCELLLLRCCEVVQIGHNSQSELLIPAQIELAQIYEDLTLYSRALLLVRRCAGILCSVYDYDHPWVIHLMHRADRLEERLEEQMRNNMATKIQATWKMHRAMQQLEYTLGHPVRRHQRIPRKYRAMPDLDFLREYVGDMPADELLGDDADDGVYGGPGGDHGHYGQQAAEPEQWTEVPPSAPVPESGRHTGDPRRPAGTPSARQERKPPYNATALVRYAPNEHAERGDTFTTLVPNATVVGTTQDTQTDTDVHHTEYGDVLTVRTTTVTKTITEDLVDSAGDDTDEEPSEDEGQPAAPLHVGAPPPQRQQQQQPRHATHSTHPPQLEPAPYPPDDDADEYDEERECSWAERAPTELQQQQQPAPQAPPPPMRREKQTQVHPCGHVVTTQTRRAPPRVNKQTEAAWPLRREEEAEPPRTSRQAATTASHPVRRETATHYNPDRGAHRAPAHQPPPPAPIPQRQPPVPSPLPPSCRRRASGSRPAGGLEADNALYPTDSTPSIVARAPESRENSLPERPPPKADRPRVHLHNSRAAENALDDEPSRSAQRGALPQQRHTQTAPPAHRSGAALEAPLDDYEDGNAPYQEEARSEVIAGSDAQPSSSAPSRLYVPDVRHNSRRELFRDLVEPNTAFQEEWNGCPAFLPLLGHRRGSGRSSQSSSMPRTSSESGQLVQHALGHNGSHPSKQQKVPIQLYDRRHQRGSDGQGQQSGMPMYLTTPTNEYPLALPQAAQQPRTVKTTRDYKVIKTRRVRTYTREPVSSIMDSENTSSHSGSVSIGESMSSAHWEVDSASVSGSTHVEYVEENDEHVDAASVNSKPSNVSAPRQQQRQPSAKTPAGNVRVPHRPHKPRMPTPPTKPLAKATGDGNGNGNGSSGDVVRRPSTLPTKAETVQVVSENPEDRDSDVLPKYSSRATKVTRHVKSGHHGTTTRTTRRFSTPHQPVTDKQR
ncbi:conserved hypothetical protein [Leishmania major strain Friedlin]|uniref:Uncharacterized protein n=1 Tax=Leishmania major TaxID=5664 RepID=O97005_LEIMA|nr:conserved hypothetical protein [Leishmania major strain Friedlin]CAC22633.1 conserved hypothetical protein [Leishmania major strain Friedlin]CAG9567791.1 hypothetical_protein_-_conserved [Leishmania major strain Friedlin]|eukprot:XP_888600.1 conserved hypothetical protein [Leishmania major strain Friedlin]